MSALVFVYFSFWPRTLLLADDLSYYCTIKYRIVFLLLYFIYLRQSTVQAPPIGISG